VNLSLSFQAEFRLIAGIPTIPAISMVRSRTVRVLFNFFSFFYFILNLNVTIEDLLILVDIVVEFMP
jgi:hypothetical protein